MKPLALLFAVVMLTTSYNANDYNYSPLAFIGNLWLPTIKTYISEHNALNLCKVEKYHENYQCDDTLSGQKLIKYNL